MRIAVGFIYVIWTIIYLSPFVPGNDFWYGVDKIVQTAIVGALSLFLSNDERRGEDERLFFSYLHWLSVAGVVYLIACLYYGKEFALYNTPLFAYILGVGFFAFMLHRAIKK